jgi:hypothetical protein
MSLVRHKNYLFTQLPPPVGAITQVHMRLALQDVSSPNAEQFTTTSVGGTGVGGTGVGGTGVGGFRVGGTRVNVEVAVSVGVNVGVLVMVGQGVTVRVMVGGRVMLPKGIMVTG